MIDLKSSIRDVPDFPKAGIVFKDITTLLKDAAAFKKAIEELCNPYYKQQIDLVIGIESRGFIFGSAMAEKLGAGFVRKPGKLPAETEKESYSLEYGEDAVEIHTDAIQQGARVLIVDDLLATGGTAAAAMRLVERLGGNVIGAAFLIELAFLHGRDKVGDVPLHVLISYDSE